MTYKNIEEYIKIAKKENNENWLSSLEKRKQEEATFHDKHREDGDKKRANKKWYTTTEKSKNYLDKWIKNNSNNLIFLDYACGFGGSTIKAGLNNAKKAIGIDISLVSIKKATQKAEEKKLSNTIFLVDDCEKTKLPNNSVDRILCCGMLHHLDVSNAFQEMHRILKPGGKILALEALNYNPLIAMYRQRTPELRTEWEKDHILTLKDVKYAKKYFKVNSIKYFHFTSPFGRYFPFLLQIFNLLDSIITKIPFIQLWSWQFTFELEKKLET